MKKLTLLLLLIALGFVACQESTDAVVEQQSKIDMSNFYAYTEGETDLLGKSSNSRDCHSMKVLNRQLNENPGLFKKMYDIEYNTRKSIAAKGKPGGGGGNGNGGGGTTDPTPYVGAITIPVIINILEDNAGDVTQAQINSQIAILNEDFNNNNPNTFLMIFIQAPALGSNLPPELPRISKGNPMPKLNAYKAEAPKTTSPVCDI